MQRVKLGLVCLSWLCLASAVSAQTELDPGANSGIASVQNYSGGGLLDGTYFDLRHVVGDGVGYINSYSQIGAFTPFWINDDAFIAQNTRLIVTNSTQTGVNVGAVARQYVNSWDRIIGAYGYYDNDEDSRNFRYSQFTVGAETLGRWWDARANGYILNGMDQNLIASQGVTGNPFFFGNRIGFLGSNLVDQAIGGADGEVGVPLSPTSPWLRGYAGLYVYHTSSADIGGFRGRLEAMVSNDLTLGLTVTQDQIYGTNINGVIDFKFSGFQPTRYFPNLTTRQRMLNPVQRNWRIATRTTTQNVDVAASNPVTGQPYFIVHVDNSKPAGGDGTIEHPFNHLVNAPQADIILVHRGLAGSSATPVTGSTVLSNNERLLGDGLLQTVSLFTHFGTSTIFGTFNLPGTSNSGIYPYVTNPGGNIVTLANNNEVSALNLFNSGGTAITNTAAGSRNFNLHNLEIFGNAGKGIDLVNASGAGMISSINVGTTNHANPQGIGNNAGGGIQVSSGVTGLFLGLTNVNMNSSPPGAQQPYGISLSALTGQMVADFNNVFTNGNVTGIALNETSQPLFVNMNFVRSERNTGVGIAISGTGGSIQVDGTNVGSLNNHGDNLDIGTQAAPIMTSSVGATFNDSNFSNSATGSGIVFSLSGGTGTLNLPAATLTSPGATVSGNAVDGLAIFATNGTLMNANVDNGFFMNNGRDAFHVEANFASTVNLNVDPTNASVSGRDGLFFQLGQDSVLNAVFLNTSLDNSGTSAVFGTLTDFAGANLFFNGTTGRFSGADGLSITATNNSVANMDIENGSFAGSGRFVGGSSAITISSDNSTVNLLTDQTLGNNIAATGLVGNQAFGLTLNIANSSVFNGNIYNGDFSDTLVDAVNANVTGSSNASLTFINTVGNRSGFDGFVANVDNSNFAVSLSNSNFFNSGRNGMTFNVTNGGQYVVSMDNSSFSNSGGSGLFGIVTGATSTANFSLMDNSFVNSSGASGLDFNVNAGTLNFTDISGSISNSGTAGVIGSGVLGVVDNGGVARLDFINTQINNNLDNGIFVTTTNGSSIQAAFSIGSIANNGSGTLSPHNNDGILLQMDNSGFSSLSVTNNAVISGNGNDGIAIVATNSTNFTGLFDTISVVNNGTASPPFVGTNAGFDITSETNSNVGLSFSGVRSGNTAVAGNQQVGLLTTTETGGLLTANLTSSDLSNNRADAINSTVGTGSVTNFNLVNVNGNDSGTIGALFNVSGGSTLTVLSSVGTSFSNEGGTGILVQVDGAGSSANFDLQKINLSNDGASFGGQGFNGLATNGATLNVVIQDGTINSNGNQGIEITATNANTVANFEVDRTTVNLNGNEGLLIDVTDQAEVNYRSVASNYNGNGTLGTLDGVAVNVTGNGPADSATALLLFANGTIDGNARNGLLLNAQNGATLTTTIINESISNNGQFGIESAASGLNTKFSLLMMGTNTLTGNGSGSFNQFDFSNMNQVVLDISGSFNNPNGDGVHVDLQNITNAAVAINGPGAIDNSGGNGIFVNMDTITNASLLINGITEINNSLSDGIQVRFNAIANGALEINGPTSIGTSGGDGVDVLLTNSNLVNGLSFGGTDIRQLTLTDNLPSPFNFTLPLPVTVAMDALGITPANALVINGMTVNGSADTAISVVATNTNIAANGAFITNNVADGSQIGDGIHVNFTTVTADGMVIADNGSQGNAGNGINIELTNTPINGLVVDGNNGGPSFAAGTLNFSFNNLIWTTTMNNNSTAGLNISQVSLDLTNTIPAQVWRPDLTPFTLPLPGAFEPTAPTDVTVGLDSVDGTAITPGNYPVQDTSGNVLPFGGVPVGSSVLTLGFNNFTPGSQLTYSLSHDTAAANSGSGQLGSTLTGATGVVTLADGRTASGVFTNAGLQITKVFAGSSNGVSGNGLDGIRFSLNNSSLTNLSVSNNTVTANGTAAGGGNGVEFTGTGGHVVGSDITNAQFNNNAITGNNGDGVRLVDPTTVANTITAEFSHNNVSSNTGTGINLSLVAGQQSLQASFGSNTVSSNTGAGINIHLANNANMTGGFDSNTVNKNGAQGINFNMGVNGVVTSNFTSNTVNGNTGDGIAITLNTGGHFEGAVFTGNQIGATGAGNGGMGVHLTVPDGASFNWNLGAVGQPANVISTNTGAGVGISMTGASTGVLNVANSSFINTAASPNPTFSGDGLTVSQSGTSILTGSVKASNFSGNANDGAKFTVPGNNAGAFAQLNNLTIGGPAVTDGNTFNSNGGNGLEFIRTADGEITNVTITNNVFDSNTLNGLSVTAANKLRTDNYTVNNNDFSLNGRNGILLSEQADAQILFNMNLNTLTNNGTNGLQIVERVNASSDSRSVSGTWTQNMFTGNKANGISINGATGQAIDPVTLAVDNLVIGDLTNLNLGNVIANNTFNGIFVTGAGNLLIGSNLITGNGILANLQTASENAGILMNVAPFSNIEVANNMISGNFGDGVQYQIGNTTSSFNGGVTYNDFASEVSIHDNTITNNSGRGVNLINRGSNETIADISNNSITANGLEGVYIVNTASTDQTIWASSTTPLLADGGVGQSGNILLHMVGNQIIGNGFNSGLSGTGLVIRVGTNEGGFGPNFAGGFASTGAALAQGASFATFLGTVNPQFGGVVAQIDNNHLGGNFGDDILFHSFTSTVNPITAAGTWNATTFTITAYQSDPLSRFDLYFRGNTVDPNSADLNGADTGGYNGGPNGSGNPALVAFYNDPDGTFKSRLDTATPPGPFAANSAGRDRNATRQAAFIPFFNQPAVGPHILYPGLGLSTWRVSNDSIDNTTFFFNGVNIDNTPYNTTNDANGIFLNNPTGQDGEMPYGYGSF